MDASIIFASNPLMDIKDKIKNRNGKRRVFSICQGKSEETRKTALIKRNEFNHWRKV
jgi:uncharacterized protein Veg